MQNLKKYIILFLILLGSSIFLASSDPSFAGEWAKEGETCTQYCTATGRRACIDTQNTSSSGQVEGDSCSNPNDPPLSCDWPNNIQSCCTCQGPRGPRPPPPCPPPGLPNNTLHCPAQDICIEPQFSCSTATNCGGAVGWRVCPSGYRVNCSPLECRLIATPTPTTVPKYVLFGIVKLNSISGKIFKDVNGDGKSVAVPPLPADSNYTKQINISLANGDASFEVTKNPDGTYSAINLLPGPYTITYSGLLPGFTFTYPPRTGLPPSNSLIVNVGPSCSVPSPSPGDQAICSSGSISNLNAGVTGNEASWFQSIGSDMRWDSGFTDIIPSTAVGGAYASLRRPGGMPGIIFSGKTTPFFGTSGGQASKNPFDWQVGSDQNPDVFKATRGLIPTSFRFLKETAERSEIPIKNISQYCKDNELRLCVLSSSIPSGIYITTDYLYLDGPNYTFPANTDIIILVNGTLYIDTKIHVPPTSTVIFSAKEHISVQLGVGEEEGASTECDITTHAGCTIEGLYSADGDFLAGGTNNCPTADLRLNIAGTVVANAGRNSQNPGIFDNKRSLCDDNSSYPSVTFTERPDFLLNYPPFVSQTTRTWQGVAP